MAHFRRSRVSRWTVAPTLRVTETRTSPRRRWPDRSPTMRSRTMSSRSVVATRASGEIEDGFLLHRNCLTSSPALVCPRAPRPVCGRWLHPAFIEQLPDGDDERVAGTDGWLHVLPRAGTVEESADAGTQPSRSSSLRIKSVGRQSPARNKRRCYRLPSDRSRGCLF